MTATVLSDGERPADPLNEACTPILSLATSLARTLAGPDHVTSPVALASRTKSTPVGLVVHDHTIPTTFDVVVVVHVARIEPLVVSTRLIDS